MNIPAFRHITLPLTFLFCTVLHAEQQPRMRVIGVPSELDRLIVQALEHNPRIAGARKLVERAESGRDVVHAFFDPSQVVTAGRSEWSRQVPGATSGDSIVNNSISATFGVETPVRPGAYLSAGVAEHYLFEPGHGFDAVYQSRFGTRIEVPLVQDRQFAKWRYRDTIAATAVCIASNHVTATCQELKHHVERAYIATLLAIADIEVVETASARVEKLLAEAQELVRMKVVPEYQVHSARMEVELYAEELARAKSAYHDLQIQLGRLVAGPDEVRVLADSKTLIDWATGNCAPNAIPLDQACARRGEYKATRNRLRMAETQLLSAQEDLKSDVSFSLSASWQGENADDPIGLDELVGEDHFGSAAVLVWKRPFGYCREHAQAAVQRADVEVLHEALREIRLRVRSEIATARTRYESAQSRLQLVSLALASAKRALSAEEERFKLGEGRSRNVLDAQKDLTAVIRRRNAAAAALLTSRSDLLYAMGHDAPCNVGKTNQTREMHTNAR